MPVLKKLHRCAVVVAVIFSASISVTAASRGSSPAFGRTTPSTVHTDAESIGGGDAQSFKTNKRRRRAKKTDAPTPSPTAAYVPTRAPFLLTTSSFGIVLAENGTYTPSSTPTDSPAAAVQTVRGATGSAEIVNKRKVPLVAILAPVLCSSFLLISLLAIYAVRRMLVLNETYAELESDASSAMTIPQGDDDENEPPAIMPVQNEAQFTLPSFKLPRLPSSSRRVKEASDTVIMHVERLEIADAGKAADNDGVCFFAGALQLAIAQEKAQAEEIPSIDSSHDASDDSRQEEALNDSAHENAQEEGKIQFAWEHSTEAEPTFQTPASSGEDHNSETRNRHKTSSASRQHALTAEDCHLTCGPLDTTAIPTFSTSFNGDERLQLTYRGKEHRDLELKLSTTSDTDISSVGSTVSL